MSDFEKKYIIWQVKIWDWFARTTPLIFLIASILSYTLGFRDWNFLYSVGAMFFVSVAVTWWFWVIYTIATMAIIIDKSGKSLKEVIQEIKEVKKVINDKKDNSDR